MRQEKQSPALEGEVERLRASGRAASRRRRSLGFRRPSGLSEDLPFLQKIRGARGGLAGTAALLGPRWCRWDPRKTGLASSTVRTRRAFGRRGLHLGGRRACKREGIQAVASGDAVARWESPRPRQEEPRFLMRVSSCETGLGALPLRDAADAEVPAKSAAPEGRRRRRRQHLGGPRAWARTPQVRATGWPQ